jgi:GT2 family glycosyltransferase/tetratricopeptide (TPR) repeat protein
MGARSELVRPGFLECGVGRRFGLLEAAQRSASRAKSPDDLADYPSGDQRRTSKEPSRPGDKSMRRYLFGPVTPAFADQNLRSQRQSGQCLAFDAAGATDAAIRAEQTWQQVLAGLPDGWKPDFVVLYLPYTSIPACLWAAPVPLVGLAADWTLLWHWYRHCLRQCDLVLTDPAGVETLAREGISQAVPANLFGGERVLWESDWPEGPRDIDILFVGNVQSAVQRERLAWLGRLARLGEHYRVAIHTGVFGAEYRALLSRSRVVFNRSLHGECNKRVIEAAAAGALLFQEVGNREIGGYLRAGEEFVEYEASNLEERLEHYLKHEEERRAVADRARAQVRAYSFEQLWDEQVGRIEAAWPDLERRIQQRLARTGTGIELPARLWQALGTVEQEDASLPRGLAHELVTHTGRAELHHALGFVTAREGKANGVEGYFRRALGCDPGHLMARLNLVEALAAAGQRQPAIDQARQTLARLEEPPSCASRNSWLDAPHYPPAFDLFRVEWERAAWSNAGQPLQETEDKRRLIRWRLHGLLAQLTGSVEEAYEAVLARPDLPSTRRGLGIGLLRAGRAAEALPHLRQAAEANPFDVEVSRVLFQAYGDAGDGAGQRHLAHERRLLAKAAPGLVPAEAWFVNCPPAGDELVSIIILCCNELAYTRLCLESVLRHTRSPYELMLVDNGSSDGTAEYLERVQQTENLPRETKPKRVVIVRNETNCGFPAGCNQGLERARGQYVVFLNNDTVVTLGWLDGLVAWSLHEWPRVGLVGAVTNYSALPQQIPIDYAELSSLDAFAARRRRAFAGKALDVARLTGFCLLVRREVLERIGRFDERYGLGFFDDDDLCVRARDAGFGLLVALDVFVHHFGSRTFRALGIDCQRQLLGNFEHFKNKWGPERAAAYRLVDKEATGEGREAIVQQARSASEPSARGPVHRRGVSLCMIVKDEELNLPACLELVVGLFEEIIVVDTGSTDRTKEIAAGFGTRVFDFPWCDSFAAARNECLRHATADWIFWLDADDRLDGANRQKLEHLLASLNAEENVAYSMKCLCLPDPVSATATVVDHIRLFRNHPEIRWKYRVHEQILPAVRRLKGTVRWSDVIVHHVGYQDPALRRRKLERDLRLLELENADNPHDPFTLFNLGSVFQELGHPAEALGFLRDSLERSHPSDSIVRKLFALIVQCNRQLGQGDEALAACESGRAHYPEDAELLFQEALLGRERGELGRAETCFLQLLKDCEAAHFASVDSGLRGFKARHNLAVLYFAQGRLAEAEAQWRAGLGEQPAFEPSWIGLGELYLAQGRLAEAEQASSSLNGSIGGTLLRARLRLAQKDFEAAKELAIACIALAPQELPPRVVLSHIFLQEGRDWSAAERSLRDILRLAPDHAEARSNLAVLLERQT